MIRFKLSKSTKGIVLIKKIEHIENAGIFYKYKAYKDLPEFKKYNLIYGWNASGKTTLSRLFRLLDDENHNEFPDLKYKIKVSDPDQTISEKIPYQIRKIKIFNKDYIEKNVHFEEGKADPIIILGEENKEISDQIKKDKGLFEKEKRIIDELKKEKDKQQKLEDNEFTDRASFIKKQQIGTATRTYNRPNAVKCFDRLFPENSKEIDYKQYLLEDKDMKKAIDQVRGKEEEKIILDEENKINLYLKELSTKLNDVKDICETVVEKVSIDRLKDNIDIQNWVNEGLSLHKKHESEKCEFCEQKISEDRLDKLKSFFNDEDRKIREKIKKVSSDIEEIESSFSSYKPQNKELLYEEFQLDYEEDRKKLEIEQKKILKGIEKLKDILKEKLNSLDKKLDTEGLSICSKNFLEHLNNLIKHIGKHNNRTEKFTETKDKAEKKIEHHYIAEIYPKITEIRNKSKSIKETIDEKEKLIENLQKKITLNEDKVSSAHKACGELNKKLESFLERKELVFEVNEKEKEEKGFSLKREEKIAKRISEGEKTAIALVYFLTTLREKEFDLENGIIVIDDPISSLDDNFVAQAFGFIKAELKRAKQVFILTHNFNFFKHVKHWLKGLDRKDENKKLAEFFMIENVVENDKREAKLSTLDPLLIKYDSEYQYLFKLLSHTKNKSLEKVYHIPNVARKFMEIFLSFKFPSKINSENKFSHARKKANFPEEKIEKIKRFINAHSHSDIGAVDINPSPLVEGPQVAEDIFDLVEKLDEDHYKGLCESIKESQAA